jgi:hypothetical protein
VKILLECLGLTALSAGKQKAMVFWNAESILMVVWLPV